MAKEDGKWVTIKGTHIFIPNGKSLSSVLKEKWKLKGTSKEKYDELRADLVESRYQKYLKTGDAGYVGDDYSKAKNDLRKVSEQTYKEVSKGMNNITERPSRNGYEAFQARDNRSLLEAKHNEMEKKREEITSNPDWARNDRLSDAYYETFREEERFYAENKVENPNEPYEPYPAYATYKEKRNKLENITQNEDGSYNYDNMYDHAEWSGKEYTNDEFLENLEDENWHTERGMLLDAHLTNAQMEFVKNNTTFGMGSPRLDREITEELIKGARGEKYRTPEEIYNKRNEERANKLTEAIKHMETHGNDHSDVMKGFEYRDYDEMKEEYKRLTGKEWQTDYKLNVEPNYTLPNGDIMNQDFIKENYSGYSPEDIQREIDFDKKTLMSQTPEGRARTMAHINEMQKYLDGMEKYESRISDDFTTGDKANGYTQGAWQGSKYDGNLDIKDIAKNVVDEMKKAYPDVKINRKISRYSGGQSADFNIVESEKPLIRNFDSFSESELERIYNTGYNKNYYNTFEDFKENFKKELERGQYSINTYHVSTNPELTEYGKAVLKDLNKVVNAYNFDDSDGQIDYFHTNFYSDVSIGNYNKPYKVVSSKANLRKKINEQAKKTRKKQG